MKAIAGLRLWPNRLRRLWWRGGWGAIAAKLRDRLVPLRWRPDGWRQCLQGARPARRRQFFRRIAAMERPPLVSVLLTVGFGTGEPGEALGAVAPETAVTAGAIAGADTAVRLGPPGLGGVAAVAEGADRRVQAAIASFESVRAQIYPHWELCVAIAADLPEATRRPIEAWGRCGLPVNLTHCKGGTAAAVATNAALALATGEVVVLLDGGDRLTDWALFRVAELWQRDRPDWFYSDEAVARGPGAWAASEAEAEEEEPEPGPDRAGWRWLFRPAFSLEFLRSRGYVVALTGFRRSLLESLGGWRSLPLAASRYDLLLRASERSQCIAHIPEILYLRRGDRASAPDPAPEAISEAIPDATATAAGRQALREHLDRCGEPADIQPLALAAGGNRRDRPSPVLDVIYRPQKPSHVAIIIPTKNCGALVRQCLDSIAATVTTAVPYDILIIDHDSTDPDTLAYFQTLRQRPHCRVLRYEGPFNFSTINNYAVRHLADRVTHLLFCNNDIEAIAPGWLERLLAATASDRVAIAGPKLLYPDGLTIQHGGVCIGMQGMAEHFGKFRRDRAADGTARPGPLHSLQAARDLSAVTAACLLMRRDVFQTIGGYDEGFAVGFGDVDLCLRSRAAGYRVVLCPSATLIHHESYSRGQNLGGDPHPQDSERFFRRWRRAILQGDPYGNPNYAISSYDWTPHHPLDLPRPTRSRCYCPRTHQITQTP